MEDNPLDLEVHEEDSLWDVWKRRIMFFVLIALCVTFAAPSFGSCTGAFEGEEADRVGSYEVDGKRIVVTERDVFRVQQRLYATFQFLGGRPPGDIPDDYVIRHILTDQAAQDAGIQITATEVGRRLMKQLPQLDKDGVFDAAQYQKRVAEFGAGRKHVEITRTLQELFRSNEYSRMLVGGIDVSSEDAYAAWREKNQRVTAAYVVQPYAALRTALESETPSAEDLQHFIGEKTKYRVPARKVIEMAYVRAAEVTDEQFARMQDYVFEQGLIEEDDAVDRSRQLAKLYYEFFRVLFDKGGSYTRDQWMKYERDRTGYTADLAKWNEEKKAHDAAAEGEKPELREKPSDPAARAETEWPPGLSIADVMDRFWRGFVGREVLGGVILEHLARRAEREQVAFEQLVPEFADLGVQYAKNEKPLEDGELAAKFPGELMKNNEAEVTVRTYLAGPKGEATFTPQVHGSAVPLTQVESRIADRGNFVVRLAGFEPSRPKNFEEVRAEATADWRAYQVTKRAREVLSGLLEKVTASGGPSLEDAAREAGLQVRRVYEFNGNTTRRTPPIVPDQAPNAAELRRVADEIRAERFVMDRYTDLAALEPGQFLKIGVLLDTPSESGYLIQLESKRYPERIEVTDMDLAGEKMGEYMKLRELEDDIVGAEALKKRYGWEDAPDTKPKSDDETADSDG